MDNYILEYEVKEKDILFFQYDKDKLNLIFAIPTSVFTDVFSNCDRFQPIDGSTLKNRKLFFDKLDKDFSTQGWSLPTSDEFREYGYSIICLEDCIYALTMFGDRSFNLDLFTGKYRNVYEFGLDTVNKLKQEIF